MFPALPVLALLLQPQPDTTLPPATAKAVYTADGVGVQVYQCTLKDGKYAWVFQEPQADLFDSATRQPLGTHTKGPTWTWTDGSSVTGKVVAQHADSNPANIPWLLLEVHSVGTSGALSSVTYVRRSNTQAGLPTNSVCEATSLNDVAKVPYKATYTFYAAGTSAQ